MEDNFLWPTAMVIDSNARIVRSVITIAKEMGRRIATADEYRRYWD
jgi:uncharacterized protein (DUF849 family)